MAVSKVVLRLADYKSQDTIKVLRAILARAERGDVIALAMCFKSKNGAEDVAFTGTYRRRKGDALGASLQITQMVNELQGFQAP